jgi:hypothetical protein
MVIPPSGGGSHPEAKQVLLIETTWNFPAPPRHAGAPLTAVALPVPTVPPNSQPRARPTV